MEGDALFSTFGKSGRGWPLYCGRQIISECVLNSTARNDISAKFMDDLSFIILRHVTDEKQNLYWNICYKCVRAFYKTVPIYIIDDHSTFSPSFLGDGALVNTEVIDSEFPPNRGEVLPYYYFYKRRFSKNTVILHDTVFINAPVGNDYLSTKSYHFLWSADHGDDRYLFRRPLEILSKMPNSRHMQSKYWSKKGWDVCFGGMAVLNLDYITGIFANTNYLEVLITEIKSRQDRMCFERIIALLLTQGGQTKSVNGDIHRDQPWGQTLSYATRHMREDKMQKAMYKVWVGRRGGGGWSLTA